VEKSFYYHCYYLLKNKPWRVYKNEIIYKIIITHKMTELIWKQVNIEKYKNVYEASNTGYIRRTNTKRVLKIHNRNGYPSICMSVNDKRKTFHIHKLIALTFLPNLNNLPVINHKDGNKENNNITNLEWCSYKNNTSHALKTKLTKPFTKKVEQYSYDGKTLIKVYNSIREAEKHTGIGNKLISAVCRGQKPTAHKFRWKYSEGYEYTHPDKVEGKKHPDYPNYIITKEGAIYSIRSKRYLTLNSTTDYKSIKLCNNGKQKDYRIHRLVAELYIPNPNNNPVVNHKDLDKNNNSVDNLEWITHTENNLHYINTRQK